jgi:predicted glycoside hydrolase/deacetylase ChbG (UPF0249 family)
VILVANADDAGVDTARNTGILEAASRGIVRSASLLAGFGGAEDFVARARNHGIGIGLHANFTEGRPLVSGHRTLVAADGLFLGKRELFRRSIAGLIDEREARRELEAAWKRMMNLGVQPTHVDGHNHAHLFPGISDVLPDVLPEGIWVRRPRGLRRAFDSADSKAFLAGADPYSSPGVLAGVLWDLVVDVNSRESWGKFRSADRFEGLTLPPGYGAADLIAVLEKALSSGAQVVELMTHPGEPAEGSVPFSASADRRREVEALTDARVLRAIEDHGVRLASFAEAP